jgi:hypothetical protein
MDALQDVNIDEIEEINLIDSDLTNDESTSSDLNINETNDSELVINETSNSGSDSNKRFKSNIWEYFTSTNLKNEQKCKLCSSKLKTSGGNTSNLWKHLKSKHPDKNKP